VPYNIIIVSSRKLALSSGKQGKQACESPKSDPQGQDSLLLICTTKTTEQYYLMWSKARWRLIWIKVRGAVLLGKVKEGKKESFIAW